MTTPPTPTPVLQVSDLRTSFRTPRGLVQAVDGVSLSLGAGETLGIVGESGSGKSVFGRTLMGLITTTKTTTVTGQVLVDGQDLHSLSRAKMRKIWGPKIAMIFQDPMTSLNPVRTIGAHLRDPLQLHMKMSRKAAHSRGIELLDEVGIPDPRRRMEQYPHELSGGMRQRVMIAIALSCSPAVLLADEPTTALDVTVQKQILDLLADLAQERSMATILISHNLGAIAGRADRVAVMYAGKLVETADTEVLFKQPHHPYTEALLDAIPILTDAPHTVLRAIEGSPPDMANPPAGCRFAPRCSRAVAQCFVDQPELLPVKSAATPRAVACHLPVGLPARIKVDEAERQA